MPKVLFIQHDHVSPAGPIAERFSDHGYLEHYFCVVPADRFFEPSVEVEWPDFTDFDVVVPLGSPWSVYDKTIATWFAGEVAQLQAADAAGVPVLGICFGAQALAVAHGGSVARADTHEIGWFDVYSDNEAVVESGLWFQYHFDAITPPPLATVIATSPRAIQAFTLRRNLGVQFHPEATEHLIELWLDPVGEQEVRDAGESPRVLQETTKLFAEQNRLRAHCLVDQFVESWK
jgi:GMP synthase-like glutamine amidotransferase